MQLTILPCRVLSGLIWDSYYFIFSTEIVGGIRSIPIQHWEWCQYLQHMRSVLQCVLTLTFFFHTFSLMPTLSGSLDIRMLGFNCGDSIGPITNPSTECNDYEMGWWDLWIMPAAWFYDLSYPNILWALASNDKILHAFTIVVIVKELLQHLLSRWVHVFKHVQSWISCQNISTLGTLSSLSSISEMCCCLVIT